MKNKESQTTIRNDLNVDQGVAEVQYTADKTTEDKNTMALLPDDYRRLSGNAVRIDHATADECCYESEGSNGEMVCKSDLRYLSPYHADGFSGDSLYSFRVILYYQEYIPDYGEPSATQICLQEHVCCGEPSAEAISAQTL